MSQLLMTMAKLDITLRVFNAERWEGDWPPADALGFMEWFGAKIGEIPAQHLSTACIEIESVSGYEGDHNASIDIYYTRPETDEELAERDRRERRYTERQLEDELRTLAHLQKKYPTGGTDDYA